MRQLKQLTFQSIDLGRHLAEWRPCFLTLIVTVYPSICIVSVIGMCSPPLLGGVADRLASCCHNHTIYDMACQAKTVPKKSVRFFVFPATKSACPSFI